MFIRFSDFFPKCTAICYEISRNLVLKLVTEFTSPRMIYPSRKVTSHSLLRTFSKPLNGSRKAAIHNKGWPRKDFTKQNVSERVDQSSLAMAVFTMELFSNPTTQLLPGNPFSSSPNFLRVWLNLEGQWEFAISERNYPSRNQEFTKRKLIFVDTKTSKLSDLYKRKPLFTYPLRIMLKHDCSHSRDTQSQQKFYHSQVVLKKATKKNNF